MLINYDRDFQTQKKLSLGKLSITIYSLEPYLLCNQCIRISVHDKKLHNHLGWTHQQTRTHSVSLSLSPPPGKTKRRFWAKFRPFSAHFPPIFRLWYPICHFSDHMFMEFAYFYLFPSIFRLKWYPHPCYKLKHGTHLLFFHPHVYGFCLFSAYIPLIFCLTFCPFLRRSFLAGQHLGHDGWDVRRAGRPPLLLARLRAEPHAGLRLSGKQQLHVPQRIQVSRQTHQTFKSACVVWVYCPEAPYSAIWPNDLSLSSESCQSQKTKKRGLKAKSWHWANFDVIF